MPGPFRAVGIDLFEGYVNVNRRRNTTPYRADRAWMKPLAAEGRVQVTESDRAQRARLDALLGLVKDDAAEPPTD